MKRIKLFGVLLLSVLMLASCRITDKPVEKQETEETTALQTEEITETEEIQSEPIYTVESIAIQPHTISENPEIYEKEYSAYLEAANAIISGKNSVEFEDAEIAKLIYYGLDENFPPIVITDFSLSDDGKSILLSYPLGRAETAEKVKEFCLKTDEILENTVNDGMTEAEKVRALFDWMLQNVSYLKTYETGNYQKVEVTAYNAVMNGKAICKGFADCFGYLLRKCGIEAMTVNAEIGDSQHAWSIVKIEGKYYHFDTTWQVGTPSKPYKYYAMTEKIRFDVNQQFYNYSIGCGKYKTEVFPEANDSSLYFYEKTE